jgi:hypothetical protein
MASSLAYREVSAFRACWHDEYVAQPLESSPDVFGALTYARTVAEDHMIRADRADISWHEETISELLWVNAQPFVLCADFARHEESVVGADWLWWWVDSSGECFGMLVQAKRLHHRDGQPQLNFGYNGGQQMARLFSAAEQLQVPAVYALYFGGTEFRGGIRCGKGHSRDCDRCRRASASLITALQAELASWSGPHDGANLAFQTSMPLEDFVNPAATGPVRDLNLEEAEPGLREFLLQEQVGARRVARELFRIVSADRTMQLSADVADRIVTATDLVFTDLPPDMGHFREPYLRHLLRGLRTRVPGYVQDVLAGEPPPPVVTGLVGGIVVIHC